MTKQNFFSIKTILNTVVINSGILFFLVFYNMVTSSELTIVTIGKIGLAVFFAYYALFSNEAMTRTKKIATTSYLALMAASIATLLIFSSEFFLPWINGLELQGQEGVSNILEVILVSVGSLSSLLAIILSSQKIISQSK